MLVARQGGNLLQAGGRLEHVRRWQQRVDTEASEFGGTASAFLDLLENDVPRAESQLLALIASLEAARRVQAGGVQAGGVEAGGVQAGGVQAGGGLPV